MVPVVSPVGLGEDGEGYNIIRRRSRCGDRYALRAYKLIYLTDVPGILVNGELVSEIGASDLVRKIEDGTIRGGMVAKAKSILRAIEGGVESVHIIDGRTAHSVIAELFTDRGSELWFAGLIAESRQNSSLDARVERRHRVLKRV